MKTIILPLFFLFLASICQADSIEMSTFIKPPVETTHRLQINQTNPTDSQCIKEGTIFFNLTNNLVVCRGGTLRTIPSPWKKNASSNIIYLQDWTNPNLNVGIGTNAPSHKFVISKETTNFSGKFNSIQIKTLDGAHENLGIDIITRGEPNGTLFGAMNNWAAFINFDAGPGSGGRIIYADRRNAAMVSWAPSGLGIVSAPDNVYDIWMDADNGNVGIGVGAVLATQALDLARSPNQQLEVNNGNLKANKIYLTAPDGSKTAELKTNYTAGGYYAVLAP